MREDLEEDEEMITLHQFGSLMLDWMNPQKAAEMWALVFNLSVFLFDSPFYQRRRGRPKPRTPCQFGY
jgi:hypothetical protein